MNEHIAKHLMKKDKTLTKDEAIQKAKSMHESYCEQNKEILEEREKVHRKQFEKSLDWEYFNLAIEYQEKTGKSPFEEE